MRYVALLFALALCSVPAQAFTFPFGSSFAPTFSQPATLRQCGNQWQQAQIDGQKTGEAQTVLRDRFVHLATRDIKFGHDLYLGRIQEHRGLAYSFLDAATFAATAAAGSVGGPQSAKAFALVATAIAGLKGSFATNFDGGGNTTSLAIQMVNTFATESRQLEENLTLDISSVSLAEACDDAQSLYDSAQKTPGGHVVKRAKKNVKAPVEIEEVKSDFSPTAEASAPTKVPPEKRDAAEAAAIDPDGD